MTDSLGTRRSTETDRQVFGPVCSTWRGLFLDHSAHRGEMLDEPASSRRIEVVVTNAATPGAGVDDPPIPGVDRDVSPATTLRCKEQQVSHRHRVEAHYYRMAND